MAEATERGKYVADTIRRSKYPDQVRSSTPVSYVPPVSVNGYTSSKDQKQSGTTGTTETTKTIPQKFKPTTINIKELPTSQTRSSSNIKDLNKYNKQQIALRQLQAEMQVGNVTNVKYNKNKITELPPEAQKTYYNQQEKLSMLNQATSFNKPLEMLPFKPEQSTLLRENKPTFKEKLQRNVETSQIKQLRANTPFQSQVTAITSFGAGFGLGVYKAGETVIKKPVETVATVTALTLVPQLTAPLILSGAVATVRSPATAGVFAGELSTYYAGSKAFSLANAKYKTSIAESRFKEMAKPEIGYKWNPPKEVFVPTQRVFTNVKDVTFETIRIQKQRGLPIERQNIEYKKEYIKSQALGTKKSEIPQSRVSSTEPVTEYQLQIKEKKVDLTELKQQNIKKELFEIAKKEIPEYVLRDKGYTEKEITKFKAQEYKARQTAIKGLLEIGIPKSVIKSKMPIYQAQANPEQKGLLNFGIKEGFTPKESQALKFAEGYVSIEKVPAKKTQKTSLLKQYPLTQEKTNIEQPYKAPTQKTFKPTKDDIFAGDVLLKGKSKFVSKGITEVPESVEIKKISRPIKPKFKQEPIIKQKTGTSTFYIPSSIISSAYKNDFISNVKPFTKYDPLIKPITNIEPVQKPKIKSTQKQETKQKTKQRQIPLPPPPPLPPSIIKSIIRSPSIPKIKPKSKQNNIFDFDNFKNKLKSKNKIKKSFKKIGFKPYYRPTLNAGLSGFKAFEGIKNSKLTGLEQRGL